MYLQNDESWNHFREISRLIETSEECILCTCWIDEEAINSLEPFISRRSSPKVIKIFSDGSLRHVPKKIREQLRCNSRVQHFFATRGSRLHSKIYYFSTNDTYVAIIGSANLTGRGLLRNDEFSKVVSGSKESSEHRELIEYLTGIEATLKPNT